VITIDDIRDASARLEGNVRRTPVISADQFKTVLPEGITPVLKLELLQVTGSFKARGATNRLLTTPREQLANGIVAASGGNHGIATARAGYLAGVKATIFLPKTATPAKISKLQEWGAETVIIGDAWQEANAAAMAFVAETGAAYFHPFADPYVVAGQGTVGLEILEQFVDVDTVLVAIGGGGLISGVSTAIKTLAPHVRVVGVAATGSPTLLRSLEAGRNVDIGMSTTKVATMSCSHTDPRIFEIVRQNVDEIVLVDDDEMAEAAKWLWFEMGLAADLSGAASIAALMKRRVTVAAGEKVCAIVCGAGPDALG
jgi:threonine dehydratase